MWLKLTAFSLNILILQITVHIPFIAPQSSVRTLQVDRHQPNNTWFHCHDKHFPNNMMKLCCAELHQQLNINTNDTKHSHPPCIHMGFGSKINKKKRAVQTFIQSLGKRKKNENKIKTKMKLTGIRWLWTPCLWLNFFLLLYYFPWTNRFDNRMHGG